MSGGHYQYKQYEIGEVAEQLESDADREENPAIAERMRECRRHLMIGAKMLHRIDWYLSGDDDVESFMERWKEESLEETK